MVTIIKMCKISAIFNFNFNRYYSELKLRQNFAKPGMYRFFLVNLVGYGDDILR